MTHGIQSQTNDSNGTFDALQAAYGKKIIKIDFSQDSGHNDVNLNLCFDDGSILIILDDYNLCCETRYMHTDDNLRPFVGHYFIGAEVRGGRETYNGPIGQHDIKFLAP